MNKNILGYSFIIGIIAFLINVSILTSGDKQEYAWHELDVISKFILTYGLISLFTLWFWMLGSHFKSGAIKSRFPILWGFLLIFGNVWTSILYFLVVYRPNETSS